MNAKDYLNKAYCLNQRINSKLRQLETLRETVQSLQAVDCTKVLSSTGYSNIVENNVIRLIEYEVEISKDIDKLIDIKNNIRLKINNMDIKYGIILEMRYLENMEWRDMANLLNYDIRHVYRLHDQALLEFKKLNI